MIGMIKLNHLPREFESMPLLDHFDLLAPLYDRLITNPEETMILQLARLPTEGNLLDAGGGTGRISQHLVQHAGQVIVLDSSIKMLIQALSKNGLRAVGSETEYLPFSDASFERVTMVDALHHVAEQKRSLQELWRVLKPGGFLVVEEPDIQHFAVKLVALAEKLALFRSHFLSPERISEHLEELGAKTQIIREKPNAWIIAEKPNVSM
jgi:ubiquinone/menaquinone biosynthesis C-methylase UbiE